MYGVHYNMHDTEASRMIRSSLCTWAPVQSCVPVEVDKVFCVATIGHVFVHEFDDVNLGLGALEPERSVEWSADLGPCPEFVEPFAIPARGTTTNSGQLQRCSNINETEKT